MGFMQSKDGSTKVFVKDRVEDESQLQVTGSLWGREFSKPFQVPSVVTPCESIERPSLESLKEGTPGHTLWILKEEKWKKEEGALWEEKKEEEASDSDDDEAKPPPSEFDCWLLEEAVTYYNRSCSASKTVARGATVWVSHASLD